MRAPKTCGLLVSRTKANWVSAQRAYDEFGTRHAALPYRQGIRRVTLRATACTAAKLRLVREPGSGVPGLMRRLIDATYIDAAAIDPLQQQPARLALDLLGGRVDPRVFATGSDGLLG